MDWKLISEIPGYEAFTNYELNITGDLRNRKTGRLLKWCVEKGYYRTSVSNSGDSKHISKHSAICKLFTENPYNKHFVDHEDRNRMNNRMDNLRWVTLTENNRNKSIPSSNTSGVQNISKVVIRKKFYWRISIKKDGKNYQKVFPRDPNSDVIPQEVIDKRNEMKRELHSLSSSI